MNQSSQKNVSFIDTVCKSHAKTIWKIQNSKSLQSGFHAVVAYSLPVDIFTIFFNSIIIVTVLRKPQFRELNQMLGLVCLAVSDLVVGVLIQPLFIAIFVNMLRGHLDCGLLKAMNFIYTLSNGLRLVSLFAVNGDRFLIIQFPYWYGASITNRVFIVSWCFAVLAFDSVGVLMQTQLDHTNHITYTVASAFGLRVIMWGCSIAVYITARKHQKRLAVAPGPADAEGIEDRKARLRNAKHGKVICFVTLFHFVIFSSAAILISIHIGKMDPPCPAFKAISSALANALVNTESMINPLVYGFCLKRIRQAVRKLFCGGHRPNDSSIRI